MFLFTDCCLRCLEMCVNFDVHFSSPKLTGDLPGGQFVVCWSWSIKTIRERFDVEQPIIILDWWSQIPANDRVASVFLLLFLHFHHSFAAGQLLCIIIRIQLNNFLEAFFGKDVFAYSCYVQPIIKRCKNIWFTLSLWTVNIFWQWENTLIKYFGCFGEWVTLMMSERKDKNEQRDDSSRTLPPAAISTVLPFFRRWVNHTHSMPGNWCAWISLPLEYFINNYDHCLNWWLPDFFGSKIYSCIEQIFQFSFDIFFHLFYWRVFLLHGTTCVLLFVR